MDFLEHNAVDDVIILSVVLDEVKHKNQSVYQRLRALCASQSRRFFVFANENHRCVYIQSNSDIELGCNNHLAADVGGPQSSLHCVPCVVAAALSFAGTLLDVPIHFAHGTMRSGTRS